MNTNLSRNLFLVLSLLTLLAFGIRCIPYHRCFQNGHVYLYGQDSYYHLLRINQAATGGFHIPRSDPYAGFPEGFQPFWPPYLDQAIAGIGWLFSTGEPSEALLLQVAAWTPPVLGALTVLPVFWLGALFFNRWIALWGTFLFALLPGHVMISIVGRMDHHVAEIFFPLCHYAFYLQARRNLLMESQRPFRALAWGSGLTLAFSY